MQRNRSAVYACPEGYGGPGRLITCAIDDYRLVACRHCPVCWGKRPPGTLILRVSNVVGIPYIWDPTCFPQVPKGPCSSPGGDYVCTYAGFRAWPDYLPPWYCAWYADPDEHVEGSGTPYPYPWCECRPSANGMFGWIWLSWTSELNRPPFMWQAAVETNEGQLLFESAPFTPELMNCAVPQPLTQTYTEPNLWTAEAEILLPG